MTLLQQINQRRALMEAIRTGELMEKGGVRGYTCPTILLTLQQGSRARCFGRFFCCTLMTLIVLIVSIIATLALVCTLPIGMGRLFDIYLPSGSDHPA